MKFTHIMMKRLQVVGAKNRPFSQISSILVEVVLMIMLVLLRSSTEPFECVTGALS